MARRLPILPQLAYIPNLTRAIEMRATTLQQQSTTMT